MGRETQEARIESSDFFVEISMRDWPCADVY